jgi:hypothetical protein
MLTITTPEVLKRRPQFIGNFWTNLNAIRQLSRLRWVINSNNNIIRKQIDLQRQPLPTRLKINLIKPTANQKLNLKNKNFKDMLVFRNFFNKRKLNDNKT